jgi:hypothetical protein
MMVRFLRWVGYQAVRFLEDTLTSYYDRWLNFLYSCSAAFLD